MEIGNPREPVVHRTLDPLPGFSLVLMKRGSQYCTLYEYTVNDGRCSRPNLWHDINTLARNGIEYLQVERNTFIEMGEFIRGYVGEDRWRLAVLETM